eukprot:1140624-Pelagomonas_calceolata.AAC.1
MQGVKYSTRILTGLGFGRDAGSQVQSVKCWVQMQRCSEDKKADWDWIGEWRRCRVTDAEHQTLGADAGVAGTGCRRIKHSVQMQGGRCRMADAGPQMQTVKCAGSRCRVVGAECKIWWVQMQGGWCGPSYMLGTDAGWLVRNVKYAGYSCRVDGADRQLCWVEGGKTGFRILAEAGFLLCAAGNAQGSCRMRFGSCRTSSGMGVMSNELRDECRHWCRWCKVKSVLGFGGLLAQQFMHSNSFMWITGTAIHAGVGGLRALPAGHELAQVCGL